MTTKHTPGPLSVSFGTKWPFEILIVNESGAVVDRQSLPCHSSKDKTFEEALNCWNFNASEQEEYAAINKRAVADAYLRAAAPDLLEALILLEAEMVASGNAQATDFGWNPAIEKTRAAIARATGEHP